jgi:hypothetical protein
MKDALIIKNMTYEFNDDDEYKGAKFVSIKKVTEFEGKQRYQTLTIKPQDWITVRSWLTLCFEKSKKAEGEEPTPF